MSLTSLLGLHGAATPAKCRKLQCKKHNSVIRMWCDSVFLCASLIFIWVENTLLPYELISLIRLTRAILLPLIKAASGKRVLTALTRIYPQLSLSTSESDDWTSPTAGDLPLVTILLFVVQLDAHLPDVSCRVKNALPSTASSCKQ